MATVVLNPSSISSVAGWESGGSTASELDKDETSNQWVGNFGVTAKMTLELDNFDNTGVASIDQVQTTFVAYLGNARSGTITATTNIRNGNTGLYSEDITVTANGGNFATYNGTARTTTDGSTAWSDTVIDALRLEVLFATPAGKTYVQQAYVTVTFTESSGYGHAVSGLAAASINKINSLATANIGKVNSLD